MVKKSFIYKSIIRNCVPNKGFMEDNFFVENNNENWKNSSFCVMIILKKLFEAQQKPLFFFRKTILNFKGILLVFIYL